MDAFTLIKTLHVIGATVILGTGAGIAFFMLMAHRTRDSTAIAHTASVVVVADWTFTASAVALQPVTGYFLARMDGLPLMHSWLGLSLALYILAGVCWLPVVWIQTRMRNLAREAATTGAPLPDAYFRLFRLWFVLGIPAFLAVLAILWLMVAKPSL
ncbi:MAG TPA: DUF2269 domain-containing protein [Caulobacteraceae bacterium]|jgi:uncharacterized membrane protein|nr:DUF2269 domain-containing protein [Caulobacteraceae bacterium]